MRTVGLTVHLEEGMYVASGHEDFEGMRYSFVAEGQTWDALKSDLQEVTNALYYDATKPDRITLHLVHDDELMVA
jgi:hypothetical protein